MSRCPDPEYGDMLHAWELGMLSEEEQRRFELHLLQCEECSEEAGQFVQVGRLLQNDPDFRPSADEFSAAISGDGKKLRFFERKVTRLLLVAAVLAIIAVPVYHITLSPGNESRLAQRLNLVPVRGGEVNMVRRGLGGIVEILFYMEDARPNNEYRVTLTTSDDSLLFLDNHYRGFRANGSGKITIPAMNLPVGICTLIISPSGDSSDVLQEYNFRVE